MFILLSLPVKNYKTYFINLNTEIYDNRLYPVQNKDFHIFYPDF
jgi:hypothetical protein